MEKISFAINDLKIIDDRNESQFATVSIDAFSSGENRHDLYVSEETLKKTAHSIYGKPLVWIYDKLYDDIGSHDDLEVPCGFVPPDSELKFTQLEDGRTMLSIVGKIWKQYSGEILSFFKRDGHSKPVSVEMEVFNTQDRNGMVEITDFCYTAITVLGSLITPAIPGAKANLVAFAKEKTAEYDKIYEVEFSKKYEYIDFSIPDSVKKNAKKGLDLRKEHKRGGTSVGLSTARYLVKNDDISEEKIRHVAKYFPRHKGDDLKQKDPPSNGYIAWLLWGGDSGWKWSQSIVDKMNEHDSKFMKYYGEKEMPYKNLKEINPALKGIEPNVSLSQANEIAKQADAIGVDEDKNGWAIAISNFKKTHEVKDGKWVKKESFAMPEIGEGDSIEINKSKDSMSSSEWGNVDKTQLMHSVIRAKNYKELVKSVYLKVDDNWEEHPSSSLHYPVMQIVSGKAVYNRYGLASALQRARAQGENEIVAKIESLYEKLGVLGEKEEMSVEEKEEKIEMQEENFEDQKQEEQVEQKEEELEKEEEKAEEQEEKEEMSADANLDVKAMLAMLSEETDVYQSLAKDFEEKKEFNYEVFAKALYEKMCKMQSDFEEMSSENKELKSFKAGIEERQFAFEVDSTFKEVDGILPNEEIAKLREESKQFSLDNLDGWKNAVKAKAFMFSGKKETREDPIYGLPFAGMNNENKKSLWD